MRAEPRNTGLRARVPVVLDVPNPDRRPERNFLGLDITAMKPVQVSADHPALGGSPAIHRGIGLGGRGSVRLRHGRHRDELREEWAHEVVGDVPVFFVLVSQVDRPVRGVVPPEPLTPLHHRHGEHPFALHGFAVVGGIPVPLQHHLDFGALVVGFLNVGGVAPIPGRNLVVLIERVRDAGRGEA